MMKTLLLLVAAFVAAAAVLAKPPHDYSPFLIKINKGKTGPRALPLNDRSFLSATNVLQETAEHILCEVASEKQIDYLAEFGFHDIERLYEKQTAYVAWRQYWGESGYHDQEQLTKFLADMKTQFPDLMSYFSIGKTNKGRELWVAKIATPVSNTTDPKPNFVYVANLHGDEAVGREMCIFMIEYLLKEYRKGDARIVRMLGQMNVYIMPSNNPDGFANKSRYNAKRKDLNRNFPDIFHNPKDTPQGKEIETQAQMAFRKSSEFTLSANFHGGILVANYPFDTNERSRSVYTPTTDDKLFIHLALIYAKNHPKLPSGPFKDGITNGAAWYTVSGGLQDWSYAFRKCMDVTMEISNNKYPPGGTLPEFWNENKESMLKYMEQLIELGIYGKVSDSATGAPIHANISVEGNTQVIQTQLGNGWYFRLLLDGQYNVKAEAAGYEVLIKPVKVEKGVRTLLHFELTKKKK